MKGRGYRAFRSFVWLVSITALVFMAGCESGSGGGSTPEKITVIAWPNSRTLPLPHMNARGDMVWVQQSETASGVYLYRNGAVNKITTDDTVPHHFPQISDTGQIIWVSKPENSQDIYAYKSGNTSKIVSVSGIPAFPRQNASGVAVWHNMTDHGLEIFKWVDNVTTQISNTGGNAFPQISETGEIIWLGNDDNGDLQVYDFKNGAITRKSSVPVNTIPQADEGNIPVFNNINASGTVVWNGRETSEDPNQVYMNKNGVVTRLTNTLYPSSRPQIADNDHVVWQTAEVDNQGNITTDIHHWHDGAAQRITSGVRAESPMVNSRGQVVWQQSDGNDTEIFLYSNGKIYQVTDNAICDVAPRIYNDGTILWVTEDSDSRGIVYRQILKTSARLITGSQFGSPVLSPLLHEIIRGSRQAAETLAGLRAPLVAASNDNQAMAPTVSPDASDTVIETFIVWGGSRGKEEDSIQGAFHPEEYYTNNNWVRNFANTAAGFVHTMPVTNMFFLGDAAMFGKDNALNYSYVHWMALMEPFLITRIPLYVAAADRDMMHSEGTAYNDTQDEFRNVLFYNVPVNGPTPWVDPHRETWNYDKLTYWMYSQTSNTLILNMDTYYVTGRLIDPMDNGEVDDHQLEWLQNSIANNDYFKSAKNRILITHSPAFDPEDNFDQPNKPNRSALWKMLAEAGFDVYLSGHDRLYSARQFTKDPFKDGQTYSRPMWQVISGAGGAETDKVDKINVNLHDWNIQTMETFLLVKFYAHGIKIIVYGTDIDYSVPPRPMDGTNEYPNLTLWIPKP